MNPGNSEPCDACASRTTCAFARLPDEARSRFRAIAQTRIHPPGTVVARQGEDAHAVLNVRSGALRLLHLTPAGRKVALRLVPASGIFGLTEVVAGTSYRFSAETVTTTALEYAPREPFVGFLHDHPRAAVGMLIWLSAEFERLERHLCESLARLPLRARMMHRLRELGESCGAATADGVAIDHPVTVQDLADSLGCSRQWASKLLGDLGRQGLIRREARRIVLAGGD